MICFYSLHELGKVEVLNKVIKEIKFVLKPKGRLIVLDYNENYNPFLYLVMRLIFLFEPKETLNYMLKQDINSFVKKYELVAIQEKLYWLDFLKLWILKKIG